MIQYPCEKCGNCCRRVSDNIIYHLLDRGDGICNNLDETTNLCTIYSHRPDICKVDYMYENFYAKDFSREDFYNINKSICKIWQQKTGKIE